MHITDIMRGNSPMFSFEFFPPKTKEAAETLYQTIRDLERVRRIMFVGGDEDQFGARIDVDILGGPEAVAARHLHIHDDEIGGELADPLERLIAVAGLADHFDPLDIAEEGTQPIDRERFIVHQQYAHRP